MFTKVQCVCPLRMQQSLRLIELITCVMSSYPGLKEATHRLLPPADPATPLPGPLAASTASVRKVRGELMFMG